ncbi:metal ABC transporter solute-binding protein, Zn/Mn family [Bacteroides sp. 224]|uniref:metal ABC transporter solute-binding protein, Zn/Mn family n=1 Tax=Bacteroides sp. 224 TaxID=2302936 RepID=UPI0013D3E937|nr:zinc ABC transporter substrate-binding protein [Bacteroides sp. 224]NDV65695.1 zinc ABC transporter substrate-binding protein [Bacteroides sp. 224]
MKTQLFILLLLVTACAGNPGKKQGERVITVTIEPQRYFTEAIAGDKFKVISMVPKGSSPETYDPTPQQLVSLGESEAYFRIGHIGFEQTWMDRLLKNAPHISVFDTSKGIDLIYGEGHTHGDHYHPGGVEPHIWNSAANAQVITSNIYKALCTLDRENESYYLARYDSINQRILHTDSILSSILTADADSAFMIYHPALSYFARDYGLEQISIEEEGKEPSPGHLKNLIEHCKAKNVRVVFVQPEFDKRNAEIIAQQTNTQIVPINPLAYDWEEEMIHTARSLSPALSKREGEGR